MRPVTHTLIAAVLILLAICLIPSGRWDVAGPLFVLSIVHLCYSTKEHP